MLGEVWSCTRWVEHPLKDVARHRWREPKFGDTVVMAGRRADDDVQPVTARTRWRSRSLLEIALEELSRCSRRRDQGVSRLHRPATFIESALHNMKHSLRLGRLVAVVLFLLSAVCGTALFPSRHSNLAVTAVIALERLGITINTITLGGLVIALGEVVDDLDHRRGKHFPSSSQKQIASHSPGPCSQVVFDVLAGSPAAVVSPRLCGAGLLPVLTLTGLQGSFSPAGHELIWPFWRRCWSR